MRRTRFMGRHGKGDFTDEGEILTDSCEQNDFVTGGTLSAHKANCKLTRTSLDGRTQSHTSNIIVDSKWRGPLQNIRVSDTLVVTTACWWQSWLKLRKARTGSSRKRRLGIDIMKDKTIKQEFCIAQRNRLSFLQFEAELHIDHFKRTMNEAATETVGYMKRTKTEWMSASTRKAKDERRQMKRKSLDSKSLRLKERAAAQYKTKDKMSRS